MVMMKVNEISQEKTRHQNDSKLLDLAYQFKKGRGLTIVTNFVEGNLDDKDVQKRAKSAETVTKTLFGLQMRLIFQNLSFLQFISELMEEKKISGFKQVLISSRMADDVEFVIRCTGIGALKANMVLVGWPTRWKETMKTKTKTSVHFFGTKAVAC